MCVRLLAADTRMVAYVLAYEPMFSAQIMFLHLEIGISALAGWMSVLIISLPIQSIVGGKVMSAWKKYISISDRRVKFIDEVIKGIKVTKMDVILNYRQREIVQLLKRVKFISVMSMINGATPSIMALIMFGTYFALGYTLSFRVVFAVITLIQMLGMTVRIYYIHFEFKCREQNNIKRYAVMLGVGGAVAVKRLTKFYNTKDQMDMILHKDANGYHMNEIDSDSFEYAVYMEDDSFKWPKIKKKDENKYENKHNEKEKEMKEMAVMIEHEFLLDNISMTLEKGKLYALVGSVKSGKSSLIKGIVYCILLYINNVLLCVVGKVYYEKWNRLRVY